jgi:hypothetical protein
MKPYQESSGLTGRDLERLDDDFSTETIDEIVPADSGGSHVMHGNSTMHTLGMLPPGTIEFTSGGTEIADPVVSEAQRRAMYAAAQGKSRLGIPKSVGKEMIAKSHGVTGLPERKGKK